MGYDPSLAPVVAPPPPKNLHSAADVPKKVEKTSSDNTTFENSVHPYRTCGSLGGFFFSVDFPNFDKKPIIPLRAVPKKSKKRQAKTRFSKKCIWLRTSPKKSKKRQAKTSLLKIRSTPIALPAPRPRLFIFCALYFSMKNLSFRCGRALESRTNVKRKPYFYKNRTPLSHLRLWRHDFRTFFRSVIFSKNIDDSIPSLKIDEKPIIPLRTSPKKSKKRQATIQLL